MPRLFIRYFYRLFSLTINDRTKRGSAPYGEAGNVHRGGGRYISLLGRNALFHDPADRWPEVVDIAAIARYASAFSQVALSLTGQTTNTLELKRPA
jgi:hypothetical protein